MRGQSAPASSTSRAGCSPDLQAPSRSARPGASSPGVGGRVGAVREGVSEAARIGHVHTNLRTISSLPANRRPYRTERGRAVNEIGSERNGGERDWTRLEHTWITPNASSPSRSMSRRRARAADDGGHDGERAPRAAAIAERWREEGKGSSRCRTWGSTRAALYTLRRWPVPALFARLTAFDARSRVLINRGEHGLLTVQLTRRPLPLRQPHSPQLSHRHVPVPPSLTPGARLRTQ